MFESVNGYGRKEVTKKKSESRIDQNFPKYPNTETIVSAAAKSSGAPVAWASTSALAWGLETI